MNFSVGAGGLNSGSDYKTLSYPLSYLLSPCNLGKVPMSTNSVPAKQHSNHRFPSPVSHWDSVVDAQGSFSFVTSTPSSLLAVTAVNRIVKCGVRVAEAFNTPPHKEIMEENGDKVQKQARHRHGDWGGVYSKAVGPFWKGTLQSPGESKSSFLLLRMALNGTVKFPRSRAVEVAQLVRAVTYEDKDLSSGPGMHVTRARHSCVGRTPALWWVGTGGPVGLAG